MPALRKLFRKSFCDYPALTSLLLLGLLYVSLFQSYRAYEIDNPWYLSFSRARWLHHGRGDLFLNGIFPDGMGGTVVFGAIPAMIQSSALCRVGWLPVPAMLLSSAFVLAGLGCWFAFLRGQRFSQQTCAAIILALGLTEPFVGMAERSRYEPVSFCLMGLAFWLAGAGRILPALFASLLALEGEPAALLVPAALLLFLVRSRVERPARLAISLSIAVAAFSLVYFSLHADIVRTLHQADWHKGEGQRQFGGFLRAYFVSRKRHLPELVLLCSAAMLYLRHRHQAPPLVRRMAEISALVSAVSLVMSWPTPAYMVFFFPFALVVVSWVLATRWHNPWLLPMVWGLLMLPQYGALAIINRHEGFRVADMRQVASAIERVEQVAGLDDRQAQIMGDYSLWYAHPEHYRALARPNLTYLPAEQLFLCFDQPLRPAAMVDPIVVYCPQLRERLSLQELEQLDLRGHRLHLLIPLRQALR